MTDEKETGDKEGVQLPWPQKCSPPYEKGKKGADGQTTVISRKVGK